MDALRGLYIMLACVSLLVIKTDGSLLQGAQPIVFALCACA